VSFLLNLFSLRRREPVRVGQPPALREYRPRPMVQPIPAWALLVGRDERPTYTFASRQTREVRP